MKFKEWIIAEATLSVKAEKSYQRFADGDKDFEEIESILLRMIEQWYEKNDYSFDYDLFQDRALTSIANKEGDTLSEILARVGKQLEKKRIKGGIRIKDEEGNEKHDKASAVLSKPVAKPVAVSQAIEIPKPVEIPKNIEIPKPVEIPKPIPKAVKKILKPILKAIEIPKEEPKKISFMNFHKPWQQKLDFSTPDLDDKPQKRLF